jgi:hypothetical protein
MDRPRMETEDLTFYHGTGAAAAGAILVSGARNSVWDEIGARALAREIREALLAHERISPAEDGRLHCVFKGAGSDYSTLCVLALRDAGASEHSHFAYGHFFVTLNLANAYRYTLGNPYRSEFILALAESLKVLKHIGHTLPNAVESRFPEVYRAINEPSCPVVLELRGISRDRLLTPDGRSDIDHTLQSFLDMQTYPGMNAPCDFRVQDVTARDMVAVHDLTDWPTGDNPSHDLWRPDADKVGQARRSVRDWLERDD